MAISREIIDQIRDRTSILEVVGRHVTLRRSGNAWTGLCPFHQEKTPSFSVVPQKGIYHCFGCQEGGDVFKFLMKVQGLTFIDAVKELAGPAGITIEERELSPEERQHLKKRATLYDVCEEAARYFQAVLLLKPEGATGRAYLERRGIRRETVERFRIGFAPAGWSSLVDHLHARGFGADLVEAAGLARRSERGTWFDFFRSRVVFPITDDRDRVVSFGGRLVEEPGAPAGNRPSPKYLNGSDTPIYHKQRVLFGLSLARSAIQKEDRALLVEGYFDVVSLAQAGIEEVVATCGTALTRDQLDVLRRFSPNVLAMFDSDAAGVKAAVRAMPLFAEAGVEAFRVEVPGAKDPDEYVQAKGGEAFRTLLAGAEPLVETVIRHVAAGSTATPLGRQRALGELAPLVARFPDVARASLVRRVADVLYLPEGEVARQVARSRGQPASPTPQATAAPATVSPELRHLLWLLVHHGDRVAPLVQECDPDWVGGGREAREVVGAMLQGIPLPTILETVRDEGLGRVLREVAAREDLYDDERVETAARQVLAALEAPWIQARLARLHQEIHAAEVGDDEARFERIRERVQLQARLVQLRRLLPRTFR